jgi:hypothetical protein
MSGKPNLFGSFWKIFRWIVLVMAVVVILLLLSKPSRPTLPMTPQEAKQQAQSFDQKWQQLAFAPAHSESAKAHFTSDEVSAGINQELAPLPAEPAAAGQQKSPGSAPNSDAAEDTPIRNVDIDFHGDQFTGQAVADVHGKDVYITVTGRLTSKDGYVVFDPTGFKIGDLAVPVSLVNDVLQKKLAEPENREKLKLPEFVQSLHIENGELVVEKKE